MFSLHLLIELISFKNYWKIAKYLVPVLKDVNQVKFYF